MENLMQYEEVEEDIKFSFKDCLMKYQEKQLKGELTLTNL